MAMFGNPEVSKDTHNPQSDEEMLESINLKCFSNHDSEHQFLKYSVCNIINYKNDE